MTAAPKLDTSGQADLEANLQEAIGIIDAGLDATDGEVDVTVMRDALSVLEAEFRDRPEFENVIKQGHVKLVRTHLLGTFLDEGAKLTKNIGDKEEDELSGELQQVLINIRVELDKVLRAAQQAAPSVAAQQTVAPVAAPEPTPVAPVVTPTPTTPVAPPAPTVKKLMTGPELRDASGKMMQSVLEDSGLYKPEYEDWKANPVSEALLRLIANLSATELAELGKFLRQPSKGYLPTEAEQYASKSPKEVEILIAGQDKAIKLLERQIQELKDSRGKGSISTERVQTKADIAKALTDLNAAEDLKGHMEIGLAHQKGAMRYQSVEQVMYMTGVWMAEKKLKDKEITDMPSELDIYNDMHTRIEDAKRGTEQKETWGLFKPRLTLILETITDKNAHLKEIGTEKMKELASSWNDRAKVEVWLKNVEGTDEYKMEKVMPPLIAYLQLAVREGLSSNVPGISGKHAENLLKHLKALRHKHAKTKVAETLGPNASEQEKMTAYFNEITKMTMSEEEINRNAITMGTGWNVMKKGGKLGLATLGGLLWGVKKIAGGAGSIGKGGVGVLGGGFKGVGKWLKGWSPESKAGVERGAKRAVFAGMVGAGAVAAGLALSPAALVAMPAVFAPEIWSKRKEIGSTVGKAGILGGAVTFAGITMPLLLIPGYARWIVKKHGEYGQRLDDKIYGPSRYTESAKPKPASKPAKAANDDEYKKKEEAA